MAMEYFSIILSALILVSAEGALSNCGQTYITLQDAYVVTLKESCDVKDCCQIKEFLSTASTGTYEVAGACNTAFTSSKSYAHCDMDTDGGKWTVIQRRINGSVNFYRNWIDYVNGFGDLNGEFWYGLDNMHCLTSRDDVELRIELGNGTQPSIVWTYQLFRVGGADTNYRLTIGQGQGVGNNVDSMAPHNGRPFSTRDRHNDAWNRNCASVYGGAWWYNACFQSNLNGDYVGHTPEDGGAVPTPAANRLVWYTGHSQWTHFTKVQMKVRPRRCN